MICQEKANFSLSKKRRFRDDRETKLFFLLQGGTKEEKRQKLNLSRKIDAPAVSLFLRQITSWRINTSSWNSRRWNV